MKDVVLVIKALGDSTRLLQRGNLLLDYWSS